MARRWTCSPPRPRSPTRPSPASSSGAPPTSPGGCGCSTRGGPARRGRQGRAARWSWRSRTSSGWTPRRPTSSDSCSAGSRPSDCSRRDGSHRRPGRPPAGPSAARRAGPAARRYGGSTSSRSTRRRWRSYLARWAGGFDAAPARDDRRRGLPAYRRQPLLRVRSWRPGAGAGSLADGVPPGRSATCSSAGWTRSGRARTVVRCASIVAEPVPDRLLRRVAGLDGATVDEALRPRRRRGLLVPEGTGYVFPTTCCAPRSRRPPARRARPAARGPRRRAGGGPSAHRVPAEVAHHVRRGPGRAEVLAVVGPGGRARRCGCWPREALHHLERALAAWPEVDDAARAGG